MFSFSTCWNSERHQDGEPMLDEIRDLGFATIELSHGIRLSLIEGIERALKNDPGLSISSLHNFCPLPVGYTHAAPNLYQLSSADKSEHQKAMRYTLQTLDFAARLKAKVVVLHLGSAPMKSFSHELFTLLQEGKRQDPLYAKTLEKALAKRAGASRGAFLQTMKSLEELVPAATQRNLRLGLESRYLLEEIPSEKEFEEIFQTFDNSSVGYWHDCGHVQVWEHLGLAEHVKWLEKFKGRLIGGHVHDVVFPHHDHHIPGDGAVPFDQLTPLWKPHILKVFEFEGGMKAKDLKKRLPAFMKKFEE